MEQTLFAYDLTKEIINAAIMLYKNTKAMVRPTDVGIVFFDIIIGVSKGDT